ncbi:unnamed protein product, partial [Symbiodinium necroappetens]
DDHIEAKAKAAEKPSLQIARADEDAEVDEAARQEELEKRARRSDVPPAIMEKAKIAQKNRKYGELLQLFAECGENWSECRISSTSSTDDTRAVVGGQTYKRYKDLVSEHGKENADRLRAEKKAKQSALGDAFEN